MRKFEDRERFCRIFGLDKDESVVYYLLNVPGHFFIDIMPKEFFEILEVEKEMMFKRKIHLNSYRNENYHPLCYRNARNFSEKSNCTDQKYGATCKIVDISLKDLILGKNDTSFNSSTGEIYHYDYHPFAVNVDLTDRFYIETLETLNITDDEAYEVAIASIYRKSFSPDNMGGGEERLNYARKINSFLKMLGKDENKFVNYFKEKIEREYIRNEKILGVFDKILVLSKQNS